MKIKTWISALAMLSGCAAAPEQEVGVSSRYDLERPSRYLVLEDSLAEVSGLAWAGDGILALVQDESMSVYKLDLKSEKVTLWLGSEHPMDNEGVAIRNGEAWVVDSEGSVYRFLHDSIQHYSTFLTRKNNVEGITWDNANNRFLLTCKGHPGVFPPSDLRSVYAFDTNLVPLSTEPLLLIRASVISEFEAAADAKGRKGPKRKKPKDRGKKMKQLFQPSDLAIHPIEGTYFVLSAASGLLAEISKEGTVLEVWNLPKNRLPKAEGITFSPDGTLYVATERGCSTCKAGLGIYPMKQFPKGRHEKD